MQSCFRIFIQIAQSAPRRRHNLAIAFVCSVCTTSAFTKFCTKDTEPIPHAGEKTVVPTFLIKCKSGGSERWVFLGFVAYYIPRLFRCIQLHLLQFRPCFFRSSLHCGGSEHSSLRNHTQKRLFRPLSRSTATRLESSQR